MAATATVSFYDPRLMERLGTRACMSMCAALAALAGAGIAGAVVGRTEEADRAQSYATRSYAETLADEARDWLTRGVFDGIEGAAGRTSQQRGVVATQVYDDELNALTAKTAAAESRSMAVAAAGAVRQGRAVSFVGADGRMYAAAPLRTASGEAVGAAAVATTRAGFAPDWAAMLGPIGLLMALVGAGVLWLWIKLARRSLTPIVALTRYLRQLAEGVEDARPPKGLSGECRALSDAVIAFAQRSNKQVRRLQALAFIDPETGLPNETHFMRATDQAIARDVAAERNTAILVVELRRMGEQVGVLDSVARRDLVKSIGRKLVAVAGEVCALGDGGVRLGLIVARTGAFEFTICAPESGPPEEAVRCAQRLCELLSEPFVWREMTFSLAPACGVAIAPRDGTSAELVLRKARLALQASRHMPANLRVFSQSLDREAAARLAIEQALREAIESDSLRAYFQPKVDLRSGRVIGAEALARWLRLDGSIVSPGQFIPIAEESGLIAPLSDAILRQACWKAASWMRAGMPISVAVNVSPLQLRDRKFADRVAHVLKLAGLPGQYLELEITESTAMSDPERVAHALGPLRALGVRLAIDDFGCGHSSLSTLSSLPFQTIKIDRQFVAALESGEAKSEAILKTILAMAGALQLDTVAEGIERREQAAFLRQAGCEIGQGFYYGGAIPARDFMSLLARQQSCAKAEAAA